LNLFVFCAVTVASARATPNRLSVKTPVTCFVLVFRLLFCFVFCTVLVTGITLLISVSIVPILVGFGIVLVLICGRIGIDWTTDVLVVVNVVGDSSIVIGLDAGASLILFFIIFYFKIKNRIIPFFFFSVSLRLDLYGQVWYILSMILFCFGFIDL